MRSKRKAKRMSKEKLRLLKEDQALRDTRSSNGRTSMCSEGFRKPNPNRFTAHVSKKSGPTLKLSIRELADLLYKEDRQ
jgi:hypothetical protein